MLFEMLGGLLWEGTERTHDSLALGRLLPGLEMGGRVGGWVGVPGPVAACSLEVGGPA